MCETRDDQITLNIAVEDWLETSEANLSLRIDAAIEAKDAAAARTQILEAITDILDVEWRFVALQRYTDSTGLERWQAVVEQRVPEKSLNGLSTRTKAVSKPGLMIRVGKVDYTPTTDEMETLNTDLRKKIYRRIRDEIAALREIYPARVFRLGTVRFGSLSEVGMESLLPSTYQDRSRSKSATAFSAVVGTAMDSVDDGADDGSTGFSVSRKVTMNATVVISSVVG